MTPLLEKKDTQILAFFLPQYHPIPENNEWWGHGFTEWMNVMRGKPLFSGHYQPHFPADLGFYDLRVPEVREHQAELAKKAGLSGFIYYHYWFNGRRLLERPVNDILSSGKPDFPFALCWANEPWSRNWDGNARHVLMPQEYSREDDLNHIAYLLEVFKDPRYIKIDGCPLFLVYRPSHMPDPKATFALWREQALLAGFPGLHLCSVGAFPGEYRPPEDFGLDALVSFKPNLMDCGEKLSSNDPLEVGYRLHSVWPYDKLVDVCLKTALPDFSFYNGVTPSWDNSVRRKEGGVIFSEATPEKYGRWLQEVLFREQMRPQKHSLVFVNAWNEWAEGNHLEPCSKWGHGYILETKSAIETAHRRFAACLRDSGTVVESSGICEGSVDEYKLGEIGALSASGWAVLPSRRIPDALFLAEELPDGRFCLLAGIRDNHRSRPDVASYLGDGSLYCAGWRFAMTLAPLVPDRSYCVLALDAPDSAFFRVGEPIRIAS